MFRATLASLLLLCLAAPIGVPAAARTGAVPRRPRPSPHDPQPFSWLKVLDGVSATSSPERAVAVRFDQQGAIFAAGSTGVNAPYAYLSSRFTVTKWSPSGGLEWTRRIEPQVTGSAPSVRYYREQLLDEARALTLDAAGNVYAAGSITSSVTGQDMAVGSWTPSGQLRWVRTLHFNDSEHETAAAIGLDPLGDVFIAGAALQSGEPSGVVAAKLRGQDGEVLWTQRLPFQASYAYDPVSLAVDPAGNAFVAGNLANLDYSVEFSPFGVLKLSGAAGHVLWQSESEYDGVYSMLGAARALTLDPDGNPVAAGEVDRTVRVVKYRSSDGVRIWRYAAPGPGIVDEATAVTADSQGDIIAVGAVGIPDGPISQFAVFKLDGATGTLMWQQTPSAGIATSVATGPGDEVIAAGPLHVPESGYQEGFSAAAWSRDGAPLWTRLHPRGGPYQSSGFSSAVDADAAGNVVVAGASANSVTGSDLAVAYVARGKVKPDRGVVMSPGTLSYALTAVGASRARRLTLRNNGRSTWSGVLRLYSIAFLLGVPGGPPPTEPVYELPFTIAPRRQVQFDVVFTPQEKGRSGGTLIVNSLGLPNGQAFVPLRGDGY